MLPSTPVRSPDLTFSMPADNYAEVNKFATKEGLPQGGDGALDAVVDEGANKYL